MKDMKENFDIPSWEASPPIAMQNRAIQALELGKVVHLSHLPFILDSTETQFLSPTIVAQGSKNISYNMHSDRLGGTLCSGSQAEVLKAMMRRFATFSCKLVQAFFPSYGPELIQARTSFRPVEASGRHISSRKDDTLLHVDAFPATPAKGQRILRVFSNVNPHGQSRHWKVGEPFKEVVKKFGPKVPKPIPLQAFFLWLLKITKERRTPYDHYMLGIHDSMKADATYQQTVPSMDLYFPPGSTWVVYTDQVSHAALAGQHLFEQTFHLPPHAMRFKESTPLAILEGYFGKKLL